MDNFLDKLTPMEKGQLRLECMKTALISCTRADISKFEVEPFADKIWGWIFKDSQK
jgi:hypothetical protein